VIEIGLFQLSDILFLTLRIKGGLNGVGSLISSAWRKEILAECIKTF
jgi:hypothetical protein